MPNLIGRSAPVITAMTPGMRRAAEVSIERMRACGCGLRRILQCRVRAGSMSSAYTARPVTFVAASTFGSGLPTTLRSALSPPRLAGEVDRLAGGWGLSVMHLPCGKLHPLQDLGVARAEAQAAGEALSCLFSLR